MREDDEKFEDKVIVEKETITKEVGGEKMEKITFRVLITTEGKTRSIVFTPAKFEKFQKDINNSKVEKTTDEKTD